MIFLYKDLTKRGLSDYQIKQRVMNNELYMIKKGVYSTTPNFEYLEYISKKHSNAVYTLMTACYCYGLLKENKTPYYVATKQKDRKIIDENIKQIFMTTRLYNLGISKITFHNYNILIYDLERLLVEIVRNKTSIDYETYHEIINNYKKIKKLLNINKLRIYINEFKNNKIRERIEKEILE